MKRGIRNNIEPLSNSSIAVDREISGYGYATSVETAAVADSSPAALTLLGQLNYFLSEYIKGILFVALSTLIIVAVPVRLIR